MTDVADSGMEPSERFAMRIHWTILMGAFLLSGIAGLIYESIWTHYLKLYLGHASYAQVLVLAAFLAGMAGGSWWASRLSHTGRDMLRGYALVEIVVGLLGLVFHRVFLAMEAWSFDTVIPGLASPVQIMAFKWSLALFLIAPQSVLLGMTFPLMVGGVLRHFRAGGGRTIASFYFVNSLGAAAGVWLSGFVLIAVAGLPGTLLVATMLNLLVGAIVLLICSRLGHSKSSAAVPAESSGRESTQVVSARLLLICALGTGLASFVYEISWIRMLNLVLGTTTHAFELMLGTFILGMALGSLWVRGVIDRLENPTRFLGYVQLAMALAAAGTLVFYNALFGGMEFLLSALDKTEAGYLLFNLVSLAVCALVMLPATFCAGMTLPLITHSLRQQKGGEAVVGRVYSVNTLGSIVGVVLVSAILIPWFGLKWAIFTGVLVDLGLGLALIAAASTAQRSRMLPTLLILPVLLIGFTVSFDAERMSSGVYFRDRAADGSGGDIVYYRDGPTASVAVKQFGNGSYSIFTNGKPDAALQLYERPPAADESTMVLLAVLPMAVAPAAREVAVVGFGSGMSSHSVLLNDNIERVDTIEIEPRMVEGAREFKSRVHRVYDDPRSHIHTEDAKTFFSTHTRRYDIILSEPSNPWVSGVAGLFSAEYYRSIKRSLSEGGILAQWIHIYEFNDELLTSVLKALDAGFTHYELYRVSFGDILVLASDQPIQSPRAHVFNQPALAAELQRVGVSSVADLQVRHIAGSELLRNYLEAVPVQMNSDYFPVVDLGAVRARYLGENADLVLPAQRAQRLLDPLAWQESLAGANLETLPFAGNNSAEIRAMQKRHAGSSIDVDGLAWLRGDTYSALLRVEELWSRCAVQGTYGAFLGDILTVSEQVEALPFGDRLAGFWRSLIDSPCYAQSSPRLQVFLDFVEAVARANDRDILLAGLAYLPTLGAEEREFVLVNMAGAGLRLGDRQTVLQVLKAAQIQASERSLIMLEKLAEG